MNKKRTFGGIESKYASAENSKIILIPVPYDGTSTWVKGSDRGPDAFLEAADNMELYDIETDSEVYREGIFLSDAVTENASPEAMTDAVHKTVRQSLNSYKTVTLFGGEHSITIGALRAFREKYPRGTVIQIDAHADLRAEYEGSACNHACAVYESSQHANLIQIGIRSMDATEKEVMDRDKVFFAHDIRADKNRDWIQRAIGLCSGPVYITIDLDAFDSSIMPSTGTPEPGGLNWQDVTGFLKLAAQQLDIKAFDIVELCPNPADKAPDFLSAKLYYKFLSYIYHFTK